MKPEDLNCWKCSASLKEVLLPLSRLSKCKSCNTDLHVCRMCQFYDTTVNNSCREPVAEKVTDKTHKNFCGYFQPSDSAFQEADTGKVASSKSQLEDLFGLNTGNKDENTDQGLSAEEEARRKLDDLFK